MSGYKSYIVAGALALYALAGLTSGKLDANRAFELIIEAAALVGIRHAVSKSTPKP